MKQKLLFLITLILSLFTQSCDFEEGNTTLSEEDRIAEMFRQAGIKVETLSKPVNPPMTEKEALIFLEAYKKRERSGLIKIPASNIEQKADGSLAVKIECNSEQKNFSRTIFDNIEKFEFTHLTELMRREIYIECYQDHGECWRSQNVQCKVTLNDLSFQYKKEIDPDTGNSPSSLRFSIYVNIYKDSGWYHYSYDENYDYSLVLWSQSAGGWVGNLIWNDVSRQ